MTENTTDKKLFTPGPLTTKKSVKEAMLRDLGSRDIEFIQIVKDIRSGLLKLASVTSDEYQAVIVQGSGTFGIESVISSVVPKEGKLLILINGAYGKRIKLIAQKHNINIETAEFAENEIVDNILVKNILEADETISHVAIVHCETTTGIINPIEHTGEIVKSFGKVFIVDAMSSFGAMPIDIKVAGIDFLVSSSNKCIEGVPGFSFVIAKTDELQKSKNRSRSVSLDLYAQWEGLESNGQFRFTPPTHVLLAFKHALAELENEGGVQGRADRYGRNYNIISKGLKELGFTEYLPEEHRGYIISSFLYPESENFIFETFYQKLNERGFVIYPGKLSNVDCFRIGSIGQLYEADMNNLLDAIKAVTEEMNIVL